MEERGLHSRLQSLANALSTFDQMAQSNALNVSAQPLFMVAVAQTKLKRQAQRVIDALPTRLCVMINTIEFYGDPAQFVVVFASGKRIEFNNIDTFPTDENIARIALECP